MGVEQRPVFQLLLSGPSKVEGRTLGLMQRCSAPLLRLSCCSMYWLSSAPTCSWSLNGLGRKLECNQARYWEDRAKYQVSKPQSFQQPSGGELNRSLYECVVLMKNLMLCECFTGERGLVSDEILRNFQIFHS